MRTSATDLIVLTRHTPHIRGWAQRLAGGSEESAGSGGAAMLIQSSAEMCRAFQGVVGSMAQRN